MEPRIVNGTIIGLSKGLIKIVIKRCKKDRLLIRQLTRPQLETEEIKRTLKTQKRKLDESDINESKKVRKDDKVEKNEVNTTSKTKIKKDKNTKNTDNLQLEEEPVNKSNSKNDKKRKADTQVLNKNEKELTETKAVKKNKKQKIDAIPVQETKPIITENSGPILSGISNFWNIPKSDNVDEESSGDEDKVRLFCLLFLI